MKIADPTSDRDLLVRLCDEHDLDISLIDELLHIEKYYQVHERRHGIYDRLRDAIFTSVHDLMKTQTSALPYTHEEAHGNSGRPVWEIREKD